jgi:PTH1 family peptidyl-tRNA hydrolase
MNRSGVAVRSVLAQRHVDVTRDLLVVVDDFALPLGTFRLRARGSSGGHNGLESVEAALDSREYARLRIGIGPLPEGVSDSADFVLEPFTGAERATLTDLLPTLGDAVECWITEGIEQAMNRYNRRGLESA